MTARPRRRLAGRSWIPAGLLAAYLLIFLALPLGTMLKAVLVGQGGWRLGEAIAVFRDNPLYIEGLVNSVATACGAAFLAGLAAIPVAVAVWRFRLRIPLVLGLFGFLPLFVPSFMLSLSLQQARTTAEELATFCRYLGVPFGFNVESVSNRRVEIEAATELAGLVAGEVLHRRV